MLKIPITAVKANVVFKAGQLPQINPENPTFILDLGGIEIHGKVNAKAARKLATHQSGTVLQGRLVAENGKLTLCEAGFQFILPDKNAEVTQNASAPDPRNKS